LSSRFDAAITTTRPLEAKPSISTSSWLSVWSFSPEMSEPRRPPTASSSSMKMIAGSCLRATSNSRRIRAAPRPANISTNDAADWAKNCAPDSCATAFASSVLPVPGGPCRRTPFGTRAPRSWNGFGSRRNSTSSSSSAFASSTPAMSANETDSSEDGLICCGLTRGITFSVRHMTKISAMKKTIITTGDQLYAAFWICCTIDVCGAAVTTSGPAWWNAATGTSACDVCA
jgi:hypothetical protein